MKALNETPHKDSIESTSDVDSRAANSNETNSSSNTSRLNKTDFLQFDASLGESDAYLQLLIEQLKSLENRRTGLVGEKQSGSAHNNNNNNNDLQKMDNNSGENVKAKQASNAELAVNNLLDNKSITSHGSDEVDKDVKVYDSVINATEVGCFWFFGDIKFFLYHFFNFDKQK